MTKNKAASPSKRSPKVKSNTKSSPRGIRKAKNVSPTEVTAIDTNQQPDISPLSRVLFSAGRMSDNLAKQTFSRCSLSFLSLFAHREKDLSPFLQPMVNHHPLDTDRLHRELYNAVHCSKDKQDFVFDNELCIVPYEISSDPKGLPIATAAPIGQKKHTQQLTNGTTAVSPTKDCLKSLLKTFKLNISDESIQQSSIGQLVSTFFNEFANEHMHSFEAQRNLLKLLTPEEPASHATDLLTRCYLYRRLAEIIQSKSTLRIAFIDGLHRAACCVYFLGGHSAFEDFDSMQCEQIPCPDAPIFASPPIRILTPRTDLNENFRVAAVRDSKVYDAKNALARKRNWRDQLIESLQVIEHEMKRTWTLTHENFFGPPYIERKDAFQERINEMQRLLANSILSNFPGIQVMTDYRKSPNSDSSLTTEQVLENLSTWPLRRLLHKGSKDLDGALAPRHIRAIMFLVVYSIHDNASFEQLLEFVTWKRHAAEQEITSTEFDMVDPMWITNYIITPTLSISAAIKKRFIQEGTIKTNRAWLKVEFIVRCSILNDIIALLVKYGPFPKATETLKTDDIDELRGESDNKSLIEGFLGQLGRYCNHIPCRKIFSTKAHYLTTMNNAGKSKISNNQFHNS